MDTLEKDHQVLKVLYVPCPPSPLFLNPIQTQPLQHLSHHLFNPQLTHPTQIIPHPLVHQHLNHPKIEHPLIHHHLPKPPYPLVYHHLNCPQRCTSPNLPSPSQSPIPSHSPSPQPSSPDISSDESDDDYRIPLEWPPSRPMVNYAGDTKIEEDYEIGWEWLEQDTGPHIAPYTGFQQCLLDPTKNNPEDFFEALFSSHMYTIMAEETNKYANRKLQRGKFFYIIFIYTKNVFFQP